MIKFFIPVFVLASIAVVSAVPQEKGSAACEACTLVLTFAQNYLEQNATDEEIIGFIKNELCTKLGSLSSTCNTYVDAYGKVLIYELAQKIDPSIVCSHIGLCSTAFKILGNDNCQLCKLGVQEIVTLINTPATEQAAINFVEKNLCSKLGQYAQQCNTIVASLGPDLFAKLIASLNPDKICEGIKLCNATIFTDLFKPKDAKTCLECKLAMTTLVTELKSPEVEQELEKSLQQLCAKLPASFQSICSVTISQYTPEIVGYLATWIQNENVCKALKICDN